MTLSACHAGQAEVAAVPWGPERPWEAATVVVAAERVAVHLAGAVVLNAAVAGVRWCRC